MSWVAVGVGAVTAVSGVIAKNKSNKDKKKVAAEIANQKEVPLENVADGMQVSTKSADLQKEALARNSATSIDALSDAGSRAVGVGVGRVAANNMDSSAAIGADLDRQQKEIDFLKANDAGNIRSTKEQRMNNKLAALSSQYNAANQNEAQSEGNIIRGLGSAATSASTSDYFSETQAAARRAKKMPVVSTVSEIKPRTIKK